jgi:HK97 family phage portal protein
LRNPFKRRAESRALPRPENELPILGAYSFTPIPPNQALAIADVWAAVRVLADSASSLPLHVYRKVNDGRMRVTGGFPVELLEQPGPGSTQADLVSTLITHLAIYGNAYIGKFRESGEIVQLGLIPPDKIRPEVQGGQLRFRYSPTTGPQQLLTTADVIHVKGLSVDGLVGLSAVSQAARVIGLSEELVKHALAFFEQGRGRPIGVLKLDPNASEDSRKRTIEVLKAENSPHQNLVIVGDGEYEPVEGKLDDSQFVEQRRLAAQEIARIFRIPPHMIGAPTGDSLTYSTVEQESINFVRYSLAPWLRRIELAISNDTDLTSRREFVKFEVDGLLRADANTRSEVYARALDPLTGWMTRAEVRQLEDLPPEQSEPQVPMTMRPPATAVATNGGSNE